MEDSLRELPRYRMERSLSQIIKSTSYLREKADYDDFYLASKVEAEDQLKNAEVFVGVIKQYIQKEISCDEKIEK